MRPLLFVALVMLAACSRHEKASTPVIPAKQVVGKVEVVTESTWPLTVRTNGTVQSKARTSIAARVMGTVERVTVAVGDRVSAGQVLVTIDARELDANRAGAEAGVAAAQAAVPEVDSVIRAAEAQLELAESTRRRMKELFDKKSLAPQEMDEAEARVRQARASLEMSRARRVQTAAQVAQAKEAVAAATTTGSYRTIIAPFAGVVTARQAEPGMVAAPGMTLLELERAGSYRLEVPVDESLAGKLRSGQAFTAWFDDAALELRVAELAPSVDAASRTILVKADLPPGHRSGGFARVEFPLGERRASSVPATAVRERGQLQMVFVVENGVARLRMVSLGETRAGRREMLSGLQPGDRVVVDPPAALADGVPVEVRP